MGKLIKNHWARLIILTAAICKPSPSLRSRMVPPSPSLRHPIPFSSVTPRTKKRKNDVNLLPTTDQVAAALEGFFWPKIFWDFLTTNLDGAVHPIPALQIINLVLGILCLAWEYPLPWLSGTRMHRSIEARLIVYPVCSLSALLLYQGTNPGIYYLVGMGAYFWAFSEGERLDQSEAGWDYIVEMVDDISVTTCRILRLNEEDTVVTWLAKKYTIT
ncbi:hypothetical protein MMC29_006038 [Sticta canariensis]|nr:hypothetical protein [Sticta canariensis]